MQWSIRQFAILVRLRDSHEITSSRRHVTSRSLVLSHVPSALFALLRAEAVLRAGSSCLDPTDTAFRCVNDFIGCESRPRKYPRLPRFQVLIMSNKAPGGIRRGRGVAIDLGIE